MSYNPFASLEDPFADTGLPPAEKLSANPMIPAVPESIADFYGRQIEAAKASLTQYEQDIERLVKKVSGLTVDSPETEEQIMALGLPLDKLYKAIEKRRKELVEEPNAYVKSVNGLAKFYQEKIDEGRRMSKNKQLVYARAKELEVRKAAEAERLARAEAQARLDAEAARMTAEAKALDEKAAAIEAPKLPEAAPAAPSKTVRTAEGSASVVKTWTFEVTDPDSIPREYLAVNEKAIRQAVKDGVRQIPGVRIFEDSSIRYGN